MSDQSINATSTECLREGDSVANPRRLRVGRDGSPSPLPESTDEPHAA